MLKTLGDYIFLWKSVFQYNITTSVSHIQRGHEIIAKTIHHAMNILSIEAELFAIRCEISQILQIQDISHISHIIVITDTIHTAKCIFDLSIHPH